MVNSGDKAETSRELRDLRDRCRRLEAAHAKKLASVHPDHRSGAINLVHYLAARESHITERSRTVCTLGLAAPGHAASSVLASIDAAVIRLTVIADRLQQFSDSPSEPIFRNDSAMTQYASAILGDPPPERDTAIMVTLPTEAASDANLLANMLEAGMNVARINCSHDDPDCWIGMINNIRRAVASGDRQCRIVMDLAGPKIRVGPMEPGPKVLRLRPRRGPLGDVRMPCRVRLVGDALSDQDDQQTCIPVEQALIDAARPGDRIRCRDARRRKRRLRVISKDKHGVVAELSKTAYIFAGMQLRLHRRGKHQQPAYRVYELPPTEQVIRLRRGDRLLLDRSPRPGAPAIENEEGRIVHPAHIALNHPAVLDGVMMGDRILLNDGKITCLVDAIDTAQISLKITRARRNGSRLCAHHGLNFPDSDIRLPAFTQTDREHLRFIARNAAAVSQSFVRDAEDVASLHDELDAIGAGSLGTILKIETEAGVANLPQILLTAMRRKSLAVMIARGDLAVEAGWARLAELQEDILSICRAARIPVIWATQVLEHAARTGVPTRAEITDAAMSQRANCVMLNKEPEILFAIRLLDDILRRMQKR